MTESRPATPREVLEDDGAARSDELDDCPGGIGVTLGAGRLEGASLIVTGGGSGIGRASALRFADEGARVLVADLDETAAERTCNEIREAGGEALGHQVDVADEASVEAMVGGALSAFGSISGAFNNAGFSEQQVAFEDTGLESWNHVLQVDLTGVFLCMKHEVGPLRRNGGGAIVNTSSVAGVASAPGRVAYTAAKHGVVGITKLAAREWAQDGIRVNVICPGLIDTPALRASMDDAAFEKLARTTTPGRIAQPSEVGDVASWLLSNESSYVSGETIVVDYAGITR